MELLLFLSSSSSPLFGDVFHCRDPHLPSTEKPSLSFVIGIIAIGNRQSPRRFNTPSPRPVTQDKGSMSSMYYPDISDHEWYSNGSVEDAGQPRRKSTVSGAVTSPDTAASNFGRDPYVATRGVEALRLEHTWQHSSSRGHEPLFIMSSPRSIFLLPSVPCQPTTPQWPVGDREQADSLLVELSESPP